MTMKTSVFAIIFSFTCLWGSVTSLQWCDEDPAERVDFCLALNIYHNETTLADDFYMRASVKFREGKVGWMAIGAGSYIMHRSLMFVMYPGTEPYSLVLGVRSTNFHDEPRFNNELPDVAIVDSRLKDGYNEVSFVCHACNQWDGVSLRSDSKSLPWIWANHPFAEADSDDPDKSLQRHMYYGSFFMDMSSAHVAEASFPTVSASRLSINAGEKTYADVSMANSGSRLIALHGLLLALSFGALYPAGAALLVWSVRWHWVVQSATAGCALFGVLIGLYRTLSASGLAGMLGLHQAVGVAVGLLLVLQGSWGWRNHTHYVREGVASHLRTYHVWLGRGLYFAGGGNALLGIAAVGEGSGLAIAWGALIVAEAMVYAWVRSRREKKRQSAVEKEVYLYAAMTSDDESSEETEQA